MGVGYGLQIGDGFGDGTFPRCNGGNDPRQGKDLRMSICGTEVIISYGEHGGVVGSVPAADQGMAVEEALQFLGTGCFGAVGVADL